MDPRLAKALMVQGTGSDVGKSLIVAGLCRAYSKRGLKVLPFKPQNMSNNAAVTAEGGEIGRAQALQARACCVKPSVHMNPVLLKPQSGTGSQIVVQGQMIGQAQAQAYQGMKPALLGAVLESFALLKSEADLVLVEGAGSASEINLRANDIANMGFAEAADVPVILLGDIDRGGVIAQIVGTKAVIDAGDSARIKGFLVNKFRGDPALFVPGMKLIESHTGWPALGLIPHCPAAKDLPAEDSMALDARRRSGSGPIKIAVPVLPGIANFDDLDPLTMEPEVSLVMVRHGETLPADADLVILVGSKTTIADLAAFRTEGWDIDLAAHVRRGGKVLGLCGGYQMLGRTIRDTHGIEGPPSEVAGLGFLDIETEFVSDKLLVEVAGVSVEDQVPFAGFEMHCGRSFGPDCARPVLRFGDGRLDGAISPNGQISGCHVHGLFNADAQRRAWLARLGGNPPGSGLSYELRIEAAIDALAAHIETYVDLDRLLAIAR